MTSWRREGEHAPRLPGCAHIPAAAGALRRVSTFSCAITDAPGCTSAIAVLPVRSCIIDGEAIACDANDLAVFELLRCRRQDHAVAACAFDLLELEGYDTRRTPIEERKGALAKLLGGAQDGIAFSEHYSGEGAMFYKHACALGCEGIVSKRLGSQYHAGRAGCWIKVKNPAAPAVRRERVDDGHCTR